jgi:hypothetical protein
VVALLAAAVMPSGVSAITVDGRLDPSYTLLSTQTTQTVAGDDSQGLADFGVGSELDAAYGTIENGVLYLFLAGNLEDTICGVNACTDSDILEVFIDSQGGGQNTLLSPSPAGFAFAGFTFDSDLAPDYTVEYFDVGALDHDFSRWAYYEELPTGGGGASYFLGSGPNAGAPGTLSGGTNPFGILATIDNRNTAGVTAGCGAASGAGVTAGVELAIPLAAIGNPTGCIKVSAFVCEASAVTVTNQSLGPLPVGTCSLGAPASVNFAGLAGEQFFTICTGATPARTATWGLLKTIYR